MVVVFFVLSELRGTKHAGRTALGLGGESPVGSSFEIRPLPGQLFGVEGFELQSQDGSRGEARPQFFSRYVLGR